MPVTQSAMRLLAALTVLSAGLAVACEREHRDVIKFGVILSLSGPAAPYGQDNQKGLQVAQAVAVAGGTATGRRLKLDVQDDAGDAAQAVTLARRFAADPSVCALIGPTRTG